MSAMSPRYKDDYNCDNSSVLIASNIYNQALPVDVRSPTSTAGTAQRRLGRAGLAWSLVDGRLRRLQAFSACARGRIWADAFDLLVVMCLEQFIDNTEIRRRLIYVTYSERCASVLIDDADSGIIVNDLYPLRQ